MFFDGLILILILHYGSDAKCRIPILKWNFVYFVILGFRSLSNFVKIIFVRQFHRYANIYALFSLIIIDGFFLAWLIYGNVLFYSHENNCNAVPSARMLYNLMFVLIVIGYF